MNENDGLVKDFLVESHENLDRMDRELLILEQDPRNPELLASIFRSIHTVKGTSGFFSFERLQAVAHAGEHLLVQLRDGRMTITPGLSSLLLRTVDALRSLLDEIERHGQEGATDVGGLIAELNASVNGQTSMVQVEPGEHHESVTRAPEGSGRVTLAERGPERVEGEANSIADLSLRVDVPVLDRLMNLVGELVLTRNQIIQHASSGNQALAVASKRLDHITAELQEGVMKTRLQPIGSAWSRLNRVVRDLSRQLGKQIRIEMSGEGTELDKSIIEAIRDPLTHMVRNAVDHGIETRDVRRQAGKAEEGCIRLCASHASGRVTIEVTDDGAGIDPERIRAAAIAKGMLGQEQAARLDERELLRLIFAPGFSTAATVTNVSGRGVGMDVVRTNIERIGGTVDIASRIGQGTCITIRIPLTLAIVPALIVRSGGERFAIPQNNLQELVRVEQGSAAIENVYGAQVYRLRGDLLPLVHLGQVLGLSGTSQTVTHIVVLQSDACRFGLVVDAVHDTSEVVVKALDQRLKNLAVFAGATIMGDGSVCLILDVQGLGTKAHALRSQRKIPPQAAIRSTTEQTRFLVFQSPDDGRMAIPLADVVRLEEIDATTIESTGGQEVVQYRGEILPLICTSALLPERRRHPRMPDAGISAGRFPVVVHAHHGRQVGLIIGRIIDTLDGAQVDLRAASRPGVAGCLVLGGKVTEILDLPALLRSVLPDASKADTP